MLRIVLSIGLAFMLWLQGQAALRAQEQTVKPSVVVAPIESRDVTPSFSFVGRVEAVDRVDLRARVEGYIEERRFREGGEVKKGDILFTLEQAPYQVVVDQRNADLAGAEATLGEAEAELKRTENLVGRGVISEADLDTAKANAATANANVLQAKAALRAAELDLSYTEITSPIDGRIGEARYSTGNLVGPSSEPLATVTSIDPIHVMIAVNEKRLIETRRQGLDIENPPVAPQLTLANGSRYEHDGNFDFLDTEVNQSTDSVQARAVFPNPNRLLLPGQFVNVVVRQKETQTALVVPQIAVQEDQQGYFVLVVNQADKVEVRRITIGNQIDGVWAVDDGLAEGERVIVQGLQKVRPDMAVNVVTEGS
ncbi:MAG: efflux RND transporter periplasmic adaptor subunit [Alphaproteobacteria bacterium]